ncbi:MAG: hypothetical protein LIO46_03335, partial [Clostridiales bacterium]|nr:hypothetical protein [Clostridiales bacterium]
QEAFLQLTADKLETVSGRELIFAVVTNVEAKLDAGVDFDALHLEQKYIYTLWYFAQTITGRQMSVFFREFGPPLTELIVPALTAVEQGEWADMVRDAYQAFDEDNETASCDKATLDGLDETFKYAYTRSAFYDACEAFIRRHLDQFIDA